MAEIKINAMSGFVIKIDMCLDGGLGDEVGGRLSCPQSMRMDIDFTLDILLGSKQNIKPNIKRMNEGC